jgi:hypothetical protein
MNDAQRTIQNIIFQADPLNNVFTSRTIITAISETVEYDLPSTVYAENSIISVWALGSNNRTTIRYDKQAFGERSVAHGYAVQNRKIIFNHAPEQNVLIIFNYRLPLMGVRSSGITAVGAAVPGPATIVEDFANDTGFTYDATKVAFSAGEASTVSQIPANATLGATYTSSIDGNWGTGDLTGTLGGSAILSGGKVNIPSPGDFLEYDGSTKYSALTGTVKLKYTPNISGRSPGIIFEDSAGGATGAFNLQFRSGSDDIYISQPGGGLGVFGGTFIPIAGVEYIFECSWNFTTGDIRLFIDGVRFGSTISHINARVNTGELRFGISYSGANSPNFKVNDVILYDSVQNTADHVADYTVAETIYVASEIELPSMVYAGTGALTSLVSSIDSVSVGTFKYTIEGKYWDGAAWVTSDGTFAQSNTVLEINTNVASIVLAIADRIEVSATVDASATISTISTFTWNIIEIPSPTLTLDTDITGVETCEEWVSVLDKYGNIVVSGLRIESFVNPALNVEGDLSDVTINDYVVYGKSATSHACLPEETETYLKLFTQRKILAHINSTKIDNATIFSSEERQDIIGLFEDKHSDIEYPTIVDYDYLDY